MQPVRRLARLDAAAARGDSRTVALSFSSEAPIVDWPGEPPLVLLHIDGAVDLERIRSVGALLSNHRADRIVGAIESVSIATDSRRGRATVRRAATDAGREALEQIRSGSLRGVSVSARPLERVLLEDGESWTDAGGREWTGPLQLARRWEVLELSTTPIPADTAVGVNRSLQRRGPMPKILDQAGNPIAGDNDGNTTAQTTLELERELHDLAEIAGLPAATARRWIDNGTSTAAARQEALDEMARRNGPVTRPGSSVDVGDAGRDRFRDAATRGLLARVGRLPDDDRDKPHEECHSLLDLAVRSLRADGLKTTGSPSQIANRALGMSSSTFAGITESTLGKAISVSFQTAPSTFRSWCKIGTSQRLGQAESRLAIGTAPDLELVRELMPITEGATGEHKETITTYTYGRRFGLSRQALVNDDLGLFDALAGGFGASAARKVEAAAYGILSSNPEMSDSVVLFHADHSNLGTAGALSGTTLAEALALMRKQQSAEGAYLSIQPRFLLVSPDDEITARELVSSATKPQESVFVDNPFRNVVEVIVTPHIASPKFYLVAGPGFATVEVDFLDGRQAPQIVRIDGTGTLGMEWIAFIDCGAAAIEPRGAVYNAGA